jgi:AcrR family transcriptional regulator
VPRPSLREGKRKQLIPLISRAFAELGDRRATTAELARRCEVQENILYRLWPDKKAMFVAAIDYVYELSSAIWSDLGARTGAGGTAAERLLEYEAQHHGEFGLYRILFAGLNELDDPDIHEALKRVYGRFHGFIERQIEGRRQDRESVPVEAALTAWAFIGLGTAANIGRELKLLGGDSRRRFITEVGRLLLGKSM